MSDRPTKAELAETRARLKALRERMHEIAADGVRLDAYELHEFAMDALETFDRAEAWFDEIEKESPDAE